MKIHVLSDLHNEMSTTYRPRVMDADVTILAGDIDIGTAGVHWALQYFPGPVIYVPGNHEYYGGTIGETLDQIRDVAQSEGQGRLHVLDRGTVEINGVRFLGATGWTEMNLHGNAPMAAINAQRVMDDYKHILIEGKDGIRTLRPDDTISESVKSRKWLTDQLQSDRSTVRAVVVITHHAPSKESLMFPNDTGNTINPAYANRWEHLVELADLWVHGHTHLTNDYMIGGGRVVANPKGYPLQETHFDRGLVIELDTSKPPDQVKESVIDYVEPTGQVDHEDRYEQQ